MRTGPYRSTVSNTVVASPTITTSEASGVVRRTAAP